jgi:urease accessory protein
MNHAMSRTMARLDSQREARALATRTCETRNPISPEHKSMRFNRTLSTAMLVVATLVPTLCFAHVGADAGEHHGAAASLAAGFLHPFSGIDHLAAMLAIGVWSALTARRVWLAPLAFAGTLAIGAVLGASGVLPASFTAANEPMIAASLLVLGLMLATRAQMPAIAGAMVAAVFALFHGAAHGQEFGGVDATFAIGGMVAASALLHVAGLGIGLAVKRRGAWLVRAVGVGVALFGVALVSQLA